MKTKDKTFRTLVLIFCMSVAIVLFGCHEMKMETTINADGSGSRHIEFLVEADGDEDSTFTLDDYRELMGVTKERGWNHNLSRRKQAQSDDIKDYHSFSRSAAADELKELTAMSGDITIKATNKNPLFAGVYFANSIEVETGVSSRGRSITYRETFAWSGLIEALIDHRLESYRSSLKQIFPRLKPQEINEWFAFVKGTFLAAVDDGIFDMGGGDRARRFAKSIERVVEFAMKKIRSYDPDADDSFLIHVTWSIFVEWDEFDETAEDMDLMGVELANGLKMTVRVDIPGGVVDTNADRQEVYADPTSGRQKLVWEIDPTDAISRRIEIYVKSEIPRE